MKKLLSVVLALALCLTAMMGCFAVSAETATPTITIEGNTVAAGENATITVTGANFVTVCGADLEITLAEGLTFVSMSKDGVALSADATENAPDYVVNGQVVKYLDLFNGFEGYETTTLNLEITATVAEGTADGDLAVTATILAADYDENELAVTINNGAVTVQNEVVPPEPVLDENINVTFSCGLGDTAYISCVVTDSQVADYASYDVQVTRYTTSGSDYNFKEIVDVIDGDKLASAGKTYWYYRGIELYSLMVPVNVVINCKDADGNIVAYSNTFTTTLKDVLAVNYANAKNRNNVKLMTAITDFINAGAAAQTYFTSGKTCDYANLELPNADWDQTYATADLGALAAFDTANNGAVTIASGAGVSAAPYVSFNMAGIDAAEVDQYTIEMSYYNELNKNTVSVSLNLTNEDVLASGGKYYAYFRSLAIYATNSEVTAKLYKSGTDEPISTYSYCFDSFITLRQNHAKLGPVVVALGKLGQSFRTLKGI